MDLDAETRYMLALSRLGSKPASPGSSRRLGRFWLVAALLFALWLVVSLELVSLGGGDKLGPGTSQLGASAIFSAMQDPAELVNWLRAAVVAGLRRLGELLVWGLLVALAVCYRRPDSAPGTGRLVLSAVLALGLAAALLAVAGLLVPLAAIPLGLTCLTGVWIGWSWSRRGAARFWLVPQLALVLALAAGGAWQVPRLVLAPTRLDLPAVEVTSADKRHLVDLLRNTADEDGFQRVRFSPRDLDLLAAWALSMDARDCRAAIRLGHDSALLQACCPVGRGDYLNVQAATRVRVEAGELEFRLLDLRLGRLRIPGWLLGEASRQGVRWLAADAEWDAALRSIRSLSVQPDAVVAVLERETARRWVSELMARQGDPDRSGQTVRIYVERLVAAAEQLPDGEEKFAGLLQTAFALARQRSQDTDPVRENRAAIYALGIVLGHGHVEWAVGRVLDPSLRTAAGRQIGRATVRGRADWVRHYTVSAALALWSTQQASDAAGLLKEELDAGHGGSGFSFSDLLANRAGTTLAIAATRDEAAARRVQQTLAGPWNLDRVFPAAADLPEGLSDAELQARFDGLGGDRYQVVIADIENRVKSTVGGE